MLLKTDSILVHQSYWGEAFQQNEGRSHPHNYTLDVALMAIAGMKNVNLYG